MSTKKEWPRLGAMELVQALTVCAATSLDPCEGCPWDEACTDLECANELNRQAAAMIQGLYNATEKAAEEKTRKLVDMAKEANAAPEWGRHGVNHAQLAEMTGVQSDLAELGRESAIRTEPVPGQDGSQRIAEVVVAGVRVFGGDADG